MRALALLAGVQPLGDHSKSECSGDGDNSRYGSRNNDEHRLVSGFLQRGSGAASSASLAIRNQIKMNPLDWSHGFQVVLFGCAPGWHGAAQIQAFQHANRDEARQSSMNHRCSSVALLGMSSRKSLAPTSRPKERQSPCSRTLSSIGSSSYGFAASKKPVFIKGSFGFVGG